MNRKLPFDKNESKKDLISTSDIYRELSERTEVENRKLREIFANFYDILAESIANDSVKTVSFDGAFRIKVKEKPRELYKNSDGSIEEREKKVTIKTTLGHKIKNPVILALEEKERN